MRPASVVSLVCVILPFVNTACSESTGTAATSGFVETKLDADVAAAGAARLDSDLVNAWGIAFGPTGVLWVSDNHTGRSTLYQADGTELPTVVMIPTSTDTVGGAPTGVIFNPTTDFTIGSSGRALFIFAGEDGTISAWNASTHNAKLVADRSPTGAVYKGLAMASTGGANFLYATNFRHDAVDVFDKTFQFVKSFTDPNVAAGFAPFGIGNIGGQLYVSFAKRLPPDSMDDEAGLGNGYVDVFDADGSLVTRFASKGSLDSPWAIVQAPAGTGALSGDLLVGNFGDGSIGVYNSSGSFLGVLRDTLSAEITIPGLWGLTFGPTSAPTTLFFAAGPNGENDGLLGTLKLR